MTVESLIKEGYSLAQDISSKDIDVIHHFLSEEAAWAKNISRSLVEKSIKNSMCFAILYQQKLVAFARIITDYATSRMP